MMARYTVDVDAFRNRVERHQRFEIGKIRRRFCTVIVVVVRMVLRLVMMMLMMMMCRHVMTAVMAVMLVMVMIVVIVVMVMMVVLLLVLLLVLMLMLVLRLRLHDDRRTVRGVLVASKQVVQLGGVQHEFRAVLVQEMFVELQHFYHHRVGRGGRRCFAAVGQPHGRRYAARLRPQPLGIQLGWLWLWSRWWRW